MKSFGIYFIYAWHVLETNNIMTISRKKTKQGQETQCRFYKLFETKAHTRILYRMPRVFPDNLSSF